MMPGPNTSWLTITNIVLGAVVLLMLLLTVAGVIWEQIARVRRRRSIEEELNHDMKQFFGRS